METAGGLAFSVCTARPVSVHHVLPQPTGGRVRKASRLIFLFFRIISNLVLITMGVWQRRVSLPREPDSAGRI